VVAASTWPLTRRHIASWYDGGKTSLILVYNPWRRGAYLVAEKRSHLPRRVSPRSRSKQTAKARAAGTFYHIKGARGGLISSTPISSYDATYQSISPRARDIILYLNLPASHGRA